MKFLNKSIVASKEAVKMAAALYKAKHGSLRGFGIIQNPKFIEQPLSILNQ
jgi:hypothetical protein